MFCPQCEIGTLRKIVFKRSLSAGYLCEYCGMMWLRGEEIDFNTGHNIQNYKNPDLEYSFDEVIGKNEDLKPVNYPKN